MLSDEMCGPSAKWSGSNSRCSPWWTAVLMYLWTLRLSSQRRRESSDKQERVPLTFTGWQEPSDSCHRNFLTVLLFTFPVDCVFYQTHYCPFMLFFKNAHMLVKRVLPMRRGVGWGGVPVLSRKPHCKSSPLEISLKTS